MTLSTQQEFFRILEEFFKRVTGKSAIKFSTLDDFGNTIRKNAEKIAERGLEAYPWGMNALMDFYTRHKMSVFQDARQVGGMKLVLGGGSRFTGTHLLAVRKMLLYCDTVLIPDPILPWIEVEREEERFQHVNLLQNAFVLLRLKPLVDADLTYPAILVFPSFEKYLEANDEETQKGIERLLVDFFSYYTGNSFETIDETLQYARKKSGIFLQQVEKNHLFIPPGGTVGMEIKKAIIDYKHDIQTWRTDEFAKVYLGLSDSELVWNGIYERLAPQWHLLENAEELHSQPMLCLNSHWHYYTLSTEMYQWRLLQNNLLKPETVNTLRALNSSHFQWLGNIPIDVLAILREQNENEEFRRKISEFTSLLHESTVDDIDRVAAEVGRGIASILSEHKKKVKEISDKYTHLYSQTLVAAWITLSALFVPALAPFVNIVPPIALVTKYALDKSNEIKEKKQLAHSLMGIFASVEESGGD